MKNLYKVLGLSIVALALIAIASPSRVFAAPSITSIAPNFGATAGGTAVTITGTGFDQADVTIGGVAATSVVLVGPTSITAETPAGAAGLADVVVTNVDTSTDTLVGGFTYLEAASPTAVDLGTAGDFVILSKTGITTTPGSVETDITGDLGISPAAASDMTGFGLVLDSSNTFSTSSLVTGRIFASDYSGGGGVTPAMLTIAVSDMEAAYTAALVPATTVLNAGTGNLGGMTLLAGVYTFDTSVTIPADLTLDGSASDVWIFQISGDLSIASATSVLLTGGATADNVFWAVAGTTTLTADSVFEGTILGGPATTAIALQDGATLNGKALGQKEVTLIGNTITDPVVSDAKILVAGVTGLVAPHRSSIPGAVGSLVAGASSYTVTSLTWSPVDDPFKASTVYTATIVLTSEAGYKFPVSGILVPTTNISGTISAGITAGGDASGNTLTFTEVFSKTGSLISGGGGGSSNNNPPSNTPAPGCAFGNLYNTSTGERCVNNGGYEIPGCGNRVTGYSTATGESCVRNRVTAGDSNAPGASGYNFGTNTLRNGSSGDAVMELQRFLNKFMNLSLVVDGKFGPKTLAAGIRFQLANGLVGDGLIGPATRAKMHTMAGQ
ncbi:MAG: ice-binding family protein [Candidatus Paceibacterota bacterium]|jgi:hypothetical protein